MLPHMITKPVQRGVRGARKPPGRRRSAEARVVLFAAFAYAEATTNTASTSRATPTFAAADNRFTPRPLPAGVAAPSARYGAVYRGVYRYCRAASLVPARRQ